MNISLPDVSAKSIGDVLRPFKIDEWRFYYMLAGKNHGAAFMLRRIIVWSGTATVKNREGNWLWKTHKQMERETGLSEYQIKQAQKRLSKIVQVKVTMREGKSRTWYRIKKNSLLREIMKTISRITGKTFSRQTQKTLPSLHERFQADTPKNCLHQSLTSYSNSSDSNIQTQTSINQEPNEQPTTTPPAQPIDDDLKLNLPDWLKGFSFHGECDVAEFIKQIERIGEDAAKAKFNETSKIGKSWQYHLNSLINEPSAKTSDTYSDVVNKPAKPQPEPKTPEPVESVPMFWQAIRQQFEMQFNRFELSGSRCQIEGDKITITLTSDYHRRNIQKSDQHPRGITYWIKRELANVTTNNQPEIVYAIGG